MESVSIYSICEFVSFIGLPMPETAKDCPDKYYISRSNTTFSFHKTGNIGIIVADGLEQENISRYPN